MQGKCKTFQQKSFHYGEQVNEYTYLSNCNAIEGCKRTTYKPNNTKYDQQGAVASGVQTMNTRVNAIRYSTADKNKKFVECKTKKCIH